ncbi:MAG: hypothetical protein WC008_00095 [Bacilli bacterium]
MKKVVSIIVLFLIVSLLSGCDFIDHQFYLRKHHSYSSIEDLSVKINKYQNDVPLFKFNISEEEHYENIQLYEHRDKIFWSYSYASSNPQMGYSYFVLLESEKSLSIDNDNFGDVVVENEEIFNNIKFRYSVINPNDQDNRYTVNSTAFFAFQDEYYFLSIIYSYYQDEIDGYLIIKDFVINTLDYLNQNHV